MFRRAFALASLLSLSGCSFIDDFDRYDPGSIDTFAEFAPPLLAGVCNKAMQCEGKGFSSFGGIFCHDRIAELSVTEFLGGQQDAPIDPDAAQRCLAFLDSPECSTRGTFFSADCEAAFLATVQPGGACTSDAQCISGRCQQVALACGGACVDTLGEGAPCSNANDDDECDYGLVCRAGSCQRPGEVGAPCESSNDCVDLTYCNAGACRPLANVGDPCAIDSTTNYSDPCRGALVCSGFNQASGRICQAGRNAGESCSSSIPCGPGLRCSMATMTCFDLVESGDACVSKDECPIAHECVSNRCTPLPLAGEACTPTFPCVQGVCQGGVCTLQAAGAACDGGNGFLFGQCDGYCTAGNLCAARGQENDPCDASVSESCDDGLTCISPGVGLPGICQACSN